jgi:nucleoside-diphosphate-sugar epimerase
MQTILGAGGVIANEIAKELPKYTNHVRLVSRNPKTVLGTEELVAADLLNAEQTANAVAGSTIVYFTAGLPYNATLWEQQWPIVMQNTIAACKKHKAKLVFFDNIYMYGKTDGWKTEETPFNPISRKGKVRAQIASMLLTEIQNGSLEAIIARAPTFYGYTKLCFSSAVVFANLVKGKKANWMMNDQSKNTIIYIPDAGKATALLGNTPTAYNQTWHLPTNKNAITGKQFIEIACTVFEVPAKYMVLKKWMVIMAGWFDKNIKESVEMLYEYQYDYLFSSAKFEKAFPDFKITNYEDGITTTARQFKNGG